MLTPHLRSSCTRDTVPLQSHTAGELAKLSENSLWKGFFATSGQVRVRTPTHVCVCVCFLSSFWPVQCTRVELAPFSHWSPGFCWSPKKRGQNPGEGSHNLSQACMQNKAQTCFSLWEAQPRQVRQGEASDNDSALGTAGEQVKPSRRHWMHQDFKGVALCLSDLPSRNLTNRQLYTTVTNKQGGLSWVVYAGRRW